MTMGEDSQLLHTLLEQERTLQFRSFTNDVALRVGMRLVEAALAEEKGVTIDIQRNGQQLFHVALPGTSPDNDDWIRRKNRVVNRFGHSSFYMGVSCRVRGVSLEERYLLDPRKYAAHGGAFPLIIRDVGVVGTITVSGLPQEEDHALVVRVLREFVEA
jgi:uncharacterized protein (UPF0303 family)